MLLLVLLGIVTLAHSQGVYRLRITDTYLEKCPHISSDGMFVDRNASYLQLQQTGVRRVNGYGSAQLTHLLISNDRSYKQQWITLPGCFRVKLNLLFTKTISNPYIEAFINMGGERPCDKHKSNPYCTPTQHFGVRLMTRNQKTCKFCDLCMAADDAELRYQHRKSGHFSYNRQKPQLSGCRDRQTIKAGQRVPLELTNICTPSKSEFDRDMNTKFGPNWKSYNQYVTRGSVVMTFHILNRHRPVPKPCLALGTNNPPWASYPGAMRARMKWHLEQRCKQYKYYNTNAPLMDEYLGCYYGFINYTLE